MHETTMHPTALPATRILGAATDDRRHLLGLVDVVVGYVSARHRHTLRGWSLQAALVEQREGFRGGETVVVRATPAYGDAVADLPPVPFGALREIASRITSTLDGIANVVPDIASCAPDVDGHADAMEADSWFGGAQTA
ncbi:MAG: hypothetical protein JWN72_679 [Thermoleophilia bacterium]|nr:hypothetical protein [Thermoleophilia bacterium]